jgi:hypothetical protein
MPGGHQAKSADGQGLSRQAPRLPVSREEDTDGSSQRRWRRRPDLNRRIEVLQSIPGSTTNRAQHHASPPRQHLTSKCRRAAPELEAIVLRWRGAKAGQVDPCCCVASDGLLLGWCERDCHSYSRLPFRSHNDNGSEQRAAAWNVELGRLLEGVRATNRRSGNWSLSDCLPHGSLLLVGLRAYTIGSGARRFSHPLTVRKCQSCKGKDRDLPRLCPA